MHPPHARALQRRPPVVVEVKLSSYARLLRVAYLKNLYETPDVYQDSYCD